MNTVQVSRLASFILAASNIYPLAYLFIKTILDRRSTTKIRFNTILLVFYGAALIGSVASAVLSFLLFVDFPFDHSQTPTQLVFNGRNILLSIGFSAISWSTFLYVRVKGKHGQI